MAKEFEIKGVAEAIQVLNQFPGAVQKKMIRPALKAAARPIVTAAKNNAPSRTGALKNQIEAFFVRSKGNSEISIAVAPRFSKYRNGKSNYYYGVFIHEGTKERKPKNAKVLVSQYGTVYGRHTKGLTANPFLRKAWQSAGDGVETNFINELVSRINDFCVKNLKKIE